MTWKKSWVEYSDVIEIPQTLQYVFVWQSGTFFYKKQNKNNWTDQNFPRLVGKFQCL